MVFTDCSGRRRWVLGLFRLLTDGFIIVSLLVKLVVVMCGKLGCYTDTRNIFSVRWSNTLNRVLNQVLLGDSIACLAMPIIRMRAA